MEFVAGDVIVVAGCGLGHVVDIEKVDMGGDPVDMYRIEVDDTGIRMWVPVTHAHAQGIRKPVAAKRIAEILAKVAETHAPEKRATWNRRQRRYNEQLMSNDPLQIAELVGELGSVVHSAKTLSFGERRMYEKARGLLEAELKVASPDAETVTSQLEEALAA